MDKRPSTYSSTRVEGLKSIERTKTMQLPRYTKCCKGILLPIHLLIVRLIHRCDCGKKAKWLYMPGNINCCDECVPRGCSCNLELRPGIDVILDDYNNIINPEEDYWQPHDIHGREYPCCEWWYLDDE